MISFPIFYKGLGVKPDVNISQDQNGLWTNEMIALQTM